MNMKSDRSKINLCLLIFLLAFGVVSSAARQTPVSKIGPRNAHSKKARVKYTLRYFSEGESAKFAVSITASGLSPSSKVAGVLSNWGEWKDIATPYVTNV